MVWLWGVEAGASVLTSSVVIVGAGATGTVAVTLVMALALVGLVGDAGFSGLIGDVGLVGFVIDFTHASEVTIQDVKDKLPYGSGHVPTRVCVIDPVYPAGQLRVWVSVVGRHVAGSALQVFWLSVHAPQTAWPYGSWQVLWRA